MKKKNFGIKGLLGLTIALATTLNSTAQITENMGTVGSNGASIASQESLNRFAEVNLTYEGTGTVRTSLPTSGYAGASGGLNIQLLATETFGFRTLNASTCTVADSITFGVGKSTNASTGSELILEYSVNNGSTWTAIPFPLLPTGTGTTFNVTPTPKYYRRAVALPAGAINANLRVRFRNSSTAQNPQFRIDDLRVTCGTPVACTNPSVTIAASGATVFCEATGSVNLTATTAIAGPTYQWYNQDGVVFGATSASLNGIVNSGTYYVVVNGAGGCQATSTSQYIKSYPTPQFCLEEITACTGATIDVCAKVAASDLIFSEYVEGSGNNKYLEIYNGTCADVDLSFYEVQTYFNGATTTGISVPNIQLSGILTVGSTYVIANKAAADTLVADLVTPNLQFNGNDAIVLYNTDLGQAADIIGSIGQNPGSSWTSTTPVLRTVDTILIRKPCVYAGIIVNPNLPGVGGFPTLANEWVGGTSIASLGTHDFGATNIDYTVSAPSSEITESGECVTLRVGAGTTTVTVTSADFCAFNGCFVAPATVATITSIECGARTMGANGMEVEGINVFPNPAVDAATVEFNNELAGNVTITLIDMQGKAVAVAGEFMEAGAQRVELKLADLNPGTYVGHVQTANGTQTFRVVKLSK